MDREGFAVRNHAERNGLHQELIIKNKNCHSGMITDSRLGH
jgi:hypothetical protein